MSDAQKHPGHSTLAQNNPGLVESMYTSWQGDPASVGPEWRLFFEGFDTAMCPRPCVANDQARAQSLVASLIYAYRSRGHFIAQLDPLGANRESDPELEISAFGFEEADLDRVFDTGHLAGAPPRATLREIVEALQATYCQSVGVEYTHIQDTRQRRWLQAQMEPVRNRPPFSLERKRAILTSLTDAELFETFVQNRYTGQKRFSLEGAESFITAFLALVELAPELGVREIVAGMAHRGRLNVLVNVLGKSYAEVFGEFEENILPDSFGGDGDVKYHLGFASDLTNGTGKTLHLSLAFNPSHLEAVDPVVLGRVRAKQRRLGDTEHRNQVLPFLVHGDAAFSGQGLVAEALNLSQLEGYCVGGCVHFVINNQIGFTTLPQESRSTPYCTDLAKMVEAPVFHVNGDDPEAVVFSTELALRFRQEFGRDVVVDIYCYRRHGHNEADEPAFTQPLLYKKIRSRPSARSLYAKHLLTTGQISAAEAAVVAAQFQEKLQGAFEQVKQAPPKRTTQAFSAAWEGLNHPYDFAPAHTTVGHDTLKAVTLALTTVPEGFALNPKVAKRLPGLRQAVEEGQAVDWAAGELLAFGSLLDEGIPVRLSGQDSARGTFSHRHAAWRDGNTQEKFVPLNHIREGQARFCVYNSSLSEAGVLGFEYGYSLDEPHMVVLWEAQFGDFANGAQVIVDQFVASSLSKWRRASALVMLLPHGSEGQGPEHSNAYLERYLAACGDDNIQVVNLTTPAQYFHALRRQVKRPFRRPLVVMSPKSLLRHPQVVSPLSELVEGRFHEILDDPATKNPTSLVLCSGKLYYDLLQARAEHKLDGVALVRVEQFYPWPEASWAEIAAEHSGVKEVVWAQEETRNRGGWSFIFPRLLELFPLNKLRYAGRDAAASPAKGSLRQHRSEQERLVREALGVT